MTTPHDPSQPDPTAQQPPSWVSPGDPFPPPGPPLTPGYGAPPPPSAPPTYGPVPGYGGPPAYVISQPTNGMALAAMICSLAGFVTCISFPVGAVLGHVSLRQLREKGEQGEGYAKTGIIVGWIGTALSLAGCLLYVLVLGAVLRSGGFETVD